MFNRLFNKQFKSDKNDSVAIVLHVITDENDEYITNLGIDSEDLEDRSLNNIGSVVVRKTWEVARKKSNTIIRPHDIHNLELPVVGETYSVIVS